jgi:hypothetical protein
MALPVSTTGGFAAGVPQALFQTRFSTVLTRAHYRPTPAAVPRACCARARHGAADLGHAELGGRAEEIAGRMSVRGGPSPIGDIE